MLTTDLLRLIGILAAATHVLGILSAVDAVMSVRTSQGSIAWSISLITFPYIALPLYWILGRSKYRGYVESRRSGESDLRAVAEQLRGHRSEFEATLDDSTTRFAALEGLAKMPFTRGNDAELLVDGEATFGAIFAGIAAARDYVLVQFFIIKDDRLGRELRDRLLERVAAGVRVFVLYDEIGSHGLSKDWLQALRVAGAHVHEFNTRRGRRNRFQINFRNHRKIVVVDGRSGYVGGLNVGDEYMGRDPKFGPWRDTHVRVEGPAVQCVQLSFLEDWYWATGEVPPWEWTPVASASGDRRVLVLPTGPADDLESCGLFYTHAIHHARRRLWIASPYFVPDDKVVAALQLAALRGVDVRIVLPQKADHKLVYLSAFSYYDETLGNGVKIYRYQPGFLHQKVMLVDDELASVGTANLDNRSFRLNFEISMVFADRAFAAEVAAMLERDFEQCREVSVDDLHRRPFWFRLASRFARLLAPVQ